MGIILLILIFAILISSIYYRINKAKIKGTLGERKISSKLSSLPNNYLVFNDIYINVAGRSTQIDHVVISIYGIFVIETKNYTGWIYGSDNSEYWTKNIYGNKYQFRNPIKQNKSHILALKQLWGISTDKFIPIVTFLNGADLKCETHEIVIYSNQLKSVILSYKNQILSSEKVKDLAKILRFASNANKGRKREHVRSVRHEITERNTMIHNGICPSCKGNLVERESKYGHFIGCSNYPKCKFRM